MSSPASIFCLHLWKLLEIESFLMGKSREAQFKYVQTSHFSRGRKNSAKAQQCTAKTRRDPAVSRNFLRSESFCGVRVSVKCLFRFRGRDWQIHSSIHLSPPPTYHKCWNCNFLNLQEICVTKTKTKRIFSSHPSDFFTPLKYFVSGSPGTIVMEWWHFSTKKIPIPSTFFNEFLWFFFSFNQILF